MSLRYKFNKAGQILSRLSPDERAAVEHICGNIQHAENRLLEAAQVILDDCGRRCQGLCCRNIHIDDIMTLLDCVHILVTAPTIDKDVKEALTREGLHSADCIFLKNGAGPCMFPAPSRPEKCIVSFCNGDGIVASEVRSVRKGFNRLARFIHVQSMHTMVRYLFGWLPGGKTGRSPKHPVEP